VSNALGNARIPRRTTQLDWRQTLGVFARYFLVERGKVAAVLALLLLVIAAETLGPMAMGNLIGAVARGNYVGASGAIWAQFGLVAFALVSAILLRQLLDRHWNGLSVRSMQRLQLDIFARVQRLPTDWHSSNLSGATVHRISRARWALDMLSNILILRLCQPLLLLVVLGGLITIRLPPAGLTFYAMSMVFIVVSVQLSAKWVRPLSMQAAARDSRLTGALADAVNNNASVKSFAAEQREDDRLHAISHDWATLAIASFNRATDTNGMQMLVWAVTQLSVIALVAWLAIHGQATVADSAFAVSATVMLSGQLRNVRQDIRTIQRAYAEMEDAAEFLVAEQEPLNADAPPAQITYGRIAFDRVRFAYPSGRQVYDNLSFSVEPGESVALVGASGAGKSTIFKLIQRLYDPSDGSIAIDGVDIAGLNPFQLRGLISSVPQEPVLFHRSLAENIGYAQPGARIEDIEDAAKRARAHGFIQQLPEGYDSLVGERGAKLSGGERQRVAIARAILADRPILLLDEATSSLDSETERLVQEAIDELTSKRTTLVIAHRLSTVRRVDRIFVFDDRRIVEQGSHAELMAQFNGQYRRLYELQNQREASLLHV
jgi:ATP-binding cassette, subfamily B, bacterial